jgi:hypothetical protein
MVREMESCDFFDLDSDSDLQQDLRVGFLCGTPMWDPCVYTLVSGWRLRQ